MGELSDFTAELKFVVPEDVAAAIKAWIETKLPADPNSVPAQGDGYRTTSLYFDTDTFDLFNRRGSTGRAKFRIRRYNGGPMVFLERKQKVEGRLSKRRSSVSLSDLSLIGAEPNETEWPGRWFVRRLRNRRLQPVCQIDYRRTARVGVFAGEPVRLTIDSGVAAQPVRGIAFSEQPGVEFLAGEAILELKYRGALPALFERLIREFDIAPRPISKYRAAAQALGFPLTPPSLAVSAVR
jgi:hypothetical protein